MYKWFKALPLLSMVLMTLTLSACGGASSEDTPSGSVNKPEPQTSSSPVSSQASTEHSSHAALSSTTETSISSSMGSSSQAQTAYSRASKGSVAFSSVSNTGSGADTTPPTNTTLEIYKISNTGITLIWEDATDNFGVASYFISRDGKKIATLKYPSYLLEDKNLTPNTAYTYSITTIDLVGNVSEESPAIIVSTLPTPNSSAVNSSKRSSISSASSHSFSSLLNSSSRNSSSRPSSSAQSISSTKSSTSTTNSSAKSSASTSSKASGSKTVTISWTHPNQRENGKFLELDEIAGYEIRFKKPTDTRFTYLMVSGNTTTELSYTGNLDGAAFEIAVFDINGLYSQYAPVLP